MEASMWAVVLFTADLQEMNSRYPSAAVCEQNHNLARKFTQVVETEMRLHGWQTSWDGDSAVIGGGMRMEYLREARGAALRRCDLWYEIWWVADQRSAIRERSDHREILRQKMGDRDFALGNWPNPVPMEHIGTFLGNPNDTTGP